MFRQARHVIFAIGLTIVFLAQACAPASTPATATRQPETASPVPATTIPSAPGDPARGKVTYDQYCLGCHPFGPQGTGPDVRGKSEDAVKRKVRIGGGGMPAYPESMISDLQLNDLAAYVSSLKKQ